MIYLSLGSNLGDREAMIARAVEELARAGVTPRRLSSLYATEPVGFLAQSWFLNCVLKAETKLTPRQLLRVVQRVEKDLGRERTTPGGPRTIDIDILLYGSSVIHASGLDVPHPRMGERRFVLVPLCELEPGLRLPRSRRSVTDLLARTADRSQVQLWGGPSERDDGVGPRR